MKKRIVTGITMGEPAGISSEITLKIWKNHRNKIEPFIFFGDPIHLLKTSSKLKFKIPIKIINEINECFKVFKNYLPVYKIKLNQKVKFGYPSIKNVNIDKLSDTKFRVFLGPFKDLNSLKKSFNAINILEFDSIEIIKK